jgi:hypothetical protein
MVDLEMDFSFPDFLTKPSFPNPQYLRNQTDLADGCEIKTQIVIYNEGEE